MYIVCSKIRTSGNWLCSTHQYEFRIVRFFQNPKNRTKRGPPVQNNQIATSHCSAEMICHILITVKPPRKENGYFAQVRFSSEYANTCLVTQDFFQFTRKFFRIMPHSNVVYLSFSNNMGFAQGWQFLGEFHSSRNREVEEWQIYILRESRKMKSITRGPRGISRNDLP